MLRNESSAELSLNFGTCCTTFIGTCGSIALWLCYAGCIILLCFRMRLTVLRGPIGRTWGSDHALAAYRISNNCVAFARLMKFFFPFVLVFLCRPTFNLLFSQRATGLRADIFNCVAFAGRQLVKEV